MDTKSSQNPVMSINFTVNLTEDTLKSFISMFGQQAINFIQGVMQQNLQKPEASDAEALARSVAPVDEPNIQSTTEDAKPTPKSFIFDFKTVASHISDAAELAASGESLDEINDMLSEQIAKETSNRVFVSIRKFHGKFLPNFYPTPEMRAIHQERWAGFVKMTKVEEELSRAFTNIMIEETPERDSTTPLPGKMPFKARKKGYSQGTYPRVRRGSGIIRMRCVKGKEQLAPMVIDPEIAEELFNNDFTHVSLGSMCKNNRPSDDSRLQLIFRKEQNKTRAPKGSNTMSRLHIYGKNSNGEPTTYSINSIEFQNKILAHFGEKCLPHKDCIFTIVSTNSKQTDAKAYEILKSDKLQNADC